MLFVKNFVMGVQFREVLLNERQDSVNVSVNIFIEGTPEPDNLSSSVIVVGTRCRCIGRLGVGLGERQRGIVSA